MTVQMMHPFGPKCALNARKESSPLHPSRRLFPPLTLGGRAIAKMRRVEVREMRTILILGAVTAAAGALAVGAASARA
ncbi:MAG TPA: hypothetical protein VFK70_20145, partial [Vicinamibacteria bacterium]|nr:hypothetical protein [Vicinamibacteria bacterium]